MKIEKGIALSEKWSDRRINGNRTKKYPWDSMEVGDSFYEKGYSQAVQSKLSQLSINYGKKHGTKYATRKEGDGTRVTRIK